MARPRRTALFPVARCAVALCLLLSARAQAQQPLQAYLSEGARRAILDQRAERKVDRALKRLQKSPLDDALLQKLLLSKRAAPYLPQALPRLADLSRKEGIGDVVNRLIRGGQNGAYELAVAHAFRKELKSVSAFVDGNEVDGLLRSGTVLEAKSGQPRRPDHLLLQVQRRAAGKNKVLLALNYMPQPETLFKLKELNRQLSGRFEVDYIPLQGGPAKVLVKGEGLERPAGCAGLLARQGKAPRVPRNARKLLHPGMNKLFPLPQNSKLGRYAAPTYGRGLPGAQRGRGPVRTARSVRRGRAAP